MNRVLALGLEPELAMALLVAAVFGFCHRLRSRSDRDHAWLQCAKWGLPLLVVPLAYVGWMKSGEHTWGWMVRVNLAIAVALLAANFLIARAHGPTWSRRKGLGLGNSPELCLAIGLTSLANAAAGARILAQHRPAFAGWIQEHPSSACLLTALAAIPLAVVAILIIGTAVILIFAVATVFNR